MKEFLIPILLMLVLGVFFGVIIAIFSKIFYVKEDKRLEEILKMMPGYNCGACGKSSCKALVDAFLNEGASIDLCRPMKALQKEKIMEYYNEHKND